eukprot:6186917-Pleurochrysis_carterae.AAC.1
MLSSSQDAQCAKGGQLVLFGEPKMSSKCNKVKQLFVIAGSRAVVIGNSCAIQRLIVCNVLGSYLEAASVRPRVSLPVPRLSALLPPSPVSHSQGPEDCLENINSEEPRHPLGRLACHQEKRLLKHERAMHTSRKPF